MKLVAAVPVVVVIALALVSVFWLPQTGIALPAIVALAAGLLVVALLLVIASRTHA